jgi:nucleotide-binding universal stress UspA family protein
VIPQAIPGLEVAAVAQFGEPAEAIVGVARALRARAILMGLKPKTRIVADSHLGWTIAYDVVSAANCPVLTVRESATRPQAHSSQ